MPKWATSFGAQVIYGLIIGLVLGFLGGTLMRRLAQGTSGLFSLGVVAIGVLATVVLGVAPSPLLDETTRRKMGEQAVALAKAALNAADAEVVGRALEREARDQVELIRSAEFAQRSAAFRR